MRLLPVLLTVLVATPLPVFGSEYRLSQRAVTIIVGTACQHLEDGETLRFVRKEIEADLLDRELTPLQARQAATRIIKTVLSTCKA
jgi:hypothetical protein